jgi:hypothetical protein
VLVMSLSDELFISIKQSHWKQSFFGVCALGASAPNSYILYPISYIPSPAPTAHSAFGAPYPFTG